MIPLVLAALAGVGAALVWSGVGRGHDVGAALSAARGRGPLRRRLGTAGPVARARGPLAAVTVAGVAVGGLIGHAVFGGVAAPLLVGGVAGSVPSAARRARTRRLRREASEAWPRVIEEIRVQTGSLGRSVPVALLAAGRAGPPALHPAFQAAQREWLLTTDLAATVRVLKSALTDPTADVVCETLLVAHELGGADLDRRLETLVADRFDDVQGRKDAHARLASARFARVFVVLVPAGMALAGMSIGSGRSAYRSTTGQAVVVAAILLVAACWAWSGRIMRLPEPERVFTE